MVLKLGSKTLVASLVILLISGLGVTTALPVEASTVSYQVTGGGFGHGLGMSQWGAKGQADAGRTFDQILTHYYQGTSVAPAAIPAEVRVGVLWNQSAIRVTSDGPFEFRHQSPGGTLLASGGAGEIWSVQPDGSGNFIILDPAGAVRATAGGGSSAVFVIWQSASLLRLPQTGHRYKYGVLELNTYTNPGWLIRGIIAGMNMQQYLYGLGEVPSSWPMEALKTQAVAGRSYAAEKIPRSRNNPSICNCDLYATTSDQVFVGYEKVLGASGSRWAQAVDATDGICVIYSGRIAAAYYSASSGGHTENNEYVWGGSPVGYLRGVTDPWDWVSPTFTWTKTYGLEELQNLLNANPDTSVGDLTNFETIEPYGVSGRVRGISRDSGGVRISGTGGQKVVSGDRIRSLLGLRSTLFRIVRAGLNPNGTVVKGSGPGVYRVEGGRLLAFPTMATLESWVRPSEIVNVSDGSLLLYKGATLGFRDGTLILTPDGTVWIVSNGRRRGFPSATVFEGLGYSFDDVVGVSWDEARIHQEGPAVESVITHPDGTLLKGSGPEIWWIQAGKRRPIPNMNIFNSRFAIGEVVNQSDTKVNSYPLGPVLGYRDGTLLITPDGAVWAVSNEYRRPFSSASALEGLGYSWTSLRSVSWEEAGIHPEGSPISSASEPHPDGAFMRGSLPTRFIKQSGQRRIVTSEKSIATWHYLPTDIARTSDTRLLSYDNGNPLKAFRDGKLISTPDGTVWMISDGLRRGFTSAEAFTGLGFAWSNILPVSWGEALIHAEGPAITSSMNHPNGSLIKGSSATVWVMQAGKKRALSSQAIFDSWFKPAEIAFTSDQRISSYPDGPVLGFRDGTLISTPEGTVWIISDGLRRGFSRASTFTGLGYSWSNVRPVSWGEAGIHPEGGQV